MSYRFPLLHPIQSGLVLILGCRRESCYCAAVMHWPFVIVTVVHHPHDDAGHHGDHDEQKQGSAHDSNYHGRVAGRKWFCKKHTIGTKHRDLKCIVRLSCIYCIHLSFPHSEAFEPSLHMFNIHSKQLLLDGQAWRQNTMKMMGKKV